MEAEMGEDIGRFGIRLCSPVDRLIESSSFFETPPREIPELGEAALFGTREIGGYSDTNNAIALFTNGVRKGNSSAFYNQGLYLLSVGLQKIGRPLPSLVCRLTLPTQMLQIESPFDPEDDNMQTDPMKRYSSSAFLWSDSRSDTKYDLFVPKDLQVFSLPYFRFSSAR